MEVSLYLDAKQLQPRVMQAMRHASINDDNIRCLCCRLRNSGLTKEQIVSAFDALERLDRELGPVYNIPITQVANAVVSIIMFKSLLIGVITRVTLLRMYTKLGRRGYSNESACNILRLALCEIF